MRYFTNIDSNSVKGSLLHHSEFSGIPSCPSCWKVKQHTHFTKARQLIHRLFTIVMTDYSFCVTTASERLIPLLQIWSVNKEYANNNDEDLYCKKMLSQHHLQSFLKRGNMACRS